MCVIFIITCYHYLDTIPIIDPTPSPTGTNGTVTPSPDSITILGLSMKQE